MGDPSRPAGTRPTLTNLTSLSDTNVSPVASKLVHRAVERAHRRISEAKEPNRAVEGTSAKRPSGDERRKKSYIFDDSWFASVPGHVDQHQHSINSAPSDSTQVLVAVASFPEESNMRVGRTESFMKRHTIPIDSEMGDVGHHIHRNRASMELETLRPGGICHETELIGTQQHGAGDTTGENDTTGATLMDEMAGEVAKKDIEVVKSFSRGFFHEIYKRFSEIAINVVNIAANSSPVPVEQPVREAHGGSPTLPSQVKHQVLGTLSEIQNHLESVRNRLKK